MNDINLATADEQELKTWAINNIDLNLTLNMKAETMRQKILDKCVELNIDPPVASVQTKADKKSGAKNTIVINVAKDKEDPNPIFVGVQGVGYSIPRGIDVAVSPAIVEVLNNAMQDIVSQDEDGEMHHEDVITYPFQIKRALAA